MVLDRNDKWFIGAAVEGRHFYASVNVADKDGVIHIQQRCVFCGSFFMYMTWGTEYSCHLVTQTNLVKFKRNMVRNAGR